LWLKDFLGSNPFYLLDEPTKCLVTVRDFVKVASCDVVFDSEEEADGFED